MTKRTHLGILGTKMQTLRVPGIPSPRNAPWKLRTRNVYIEKRSFGRYKS